MDLKHKIGQLFMIGFKGTDPGPANDLIDEFQAGGVILFHRNCQTADQVRETLGALQAGREACRLLIAIDQEGGPWTILGEHICPAFPTNWEHAQRFLSTGDPEPVRRQALLTAEVHRGLGINMNLAPVLDVVTHSGNQVISTRAFGDDTAIVTQLGTEYITALQGAGIIATAKHFPGHGPTDVDSHKALPTVHMKRGEIEAIHLPPFKAAVNAGVDAVMTAHMVYSAVSESPATLSREWLTEELRGRLGFTGIVITDDMNMLAIADNFDRGAAAVAALNAGVDILLVCHDPETIRAMHGAVVAAAESGALDPARIEESYQRVMGVKRKYGLAGG